MEPKIRLLKGRILKGGILILIILLSFALGYIFASQNSQAPIIIEKNS